MGAEPVDIVLFYGQSNAGNGGGDKALLVEKCHESPRAMTFSSRRQAYGTGAVVPTDLVGLAPILDHPRYPPIPATAMGHALANKPSGLEGRPKHFFFTSWHGGQPLSSFARGTKAWGNLMTGAAMAKKALAEEGFDGAVSALVFIQGEGGPWGQRAYERQLDELFDDLLPTIQSELGQERKPTVMLLQTNKGANDRGAPSGVELAQWEIARRRKDTIMVGPSYHLPLVDNIHQCAVGRMVMGDILSLAYDLLQQAIPFVPLHPKVATREGRVICVDFQLPPMAGPLQWDRKWIASSRHFGFEVRDRDRSVGIEEVFISGPSEVSIVLEKKSIRGDHKVRYAQGQTPKSGWASGRGQLISGTSHRSHFHSFDYRVPAYVNHYCIRFEQAVSA